MSTSSQSTLALVRTVSSVDHTRSFAHFQHFLDSGSVQSVLLASTILQSSCKGPWQSPSVNSPCHIEQSQTSYQSRTQIDAVRLQHISQCCLSQATQSPLHSQSARQSHSRSSVLENHSPSTGRRSQSGSLVADHSSSRHDSVFPST